MASEGLRLLNAAQVERLFTRFPGETGRSVQRTFIDHGNQFLGDFTKQRLSGAGPASVAARTNQLRGSAASRPFGSPSNLDSLGVRFQLGTKYARLHEFGTQGAGGSLPDIQPKNVQWLTIPVGDALTGAGTAPARARDFPGLSFIPRSADTALLADTHGGELNVLFILKKRISIPPRLHLISDWKKAVPSFRKRLSMVLAPLFRRLAPSG